MLKTKRFKFVLVAMLMFTMVTMYGSAPIVRAASLESAKDTISDSDLGATANHTIEFDMATQLEQNDYVRVIFDALFNLSTATGTCPTNTTLSTSTTYIQCTVNAGLTLASTSLQTITGVGIVNPGVAGSYDVTITTYNDAGPVEIESAGVKVYILEDVTVSATVNASLTFAVGELGPDSGTSIVNGIPVTASSSSTTLPFGTLDSSASTTLGHSLAVSTNATDGFSVTVIMDQELTSAAGATIDSFSNGVIPVAPTSWAIPSGTLDAIGTYGHMGVTTDDSDLAATFDNGLFDGISTTTPLEVMSHNGPADGSTVDKGLANVAYSIEITDLQESGDYTAALTYVCTPTY